MNWCAAQELVVDIASVSHLANIVRCTSEGVPPYELTAELLVAIVCLLDMWARD